MLQMFKSMYVLLFSYWKKSFHNIFFSFIFPIMFLAIMNAAFNSHGSLTPGMVASACPVVGIVSLSISYSDLKDTIIYKRIAVLPLKPWVFITSIISFFTILTWLSAAWIFLFSLAVYGSSFSYASGVNFGYFILGIVLLSIICSSIGVIIGCLAKDYKIANAFSMLFYLPPAFLSGMYLPINMITSSTALKILSMILPYTYPVSLINYGWGSEGALLFGSQVWPFILISILLVIAFVGLAIVVYKFRKKK